MAKDRSKHKRHFILENTILPEPFRPRGGGNSPEIPSRNRQQHGGRLLQQLASLKPDAEQARFAQESAGLDEGFGLQVEFESFPDIELAFESLAKERSGIELLNVRHERELTLATVFVPDGKLHILENLVTAYLDESKDSKKGLPKNHVLLDAIRNIRAASIKALWTDDPEVFPQSNEETLWWEVWLPVRDDRIAVTEKFKQLAGGLDFRIAQGQIEFPERTILLVYGSLGQMQQGTYTERYESASSAVAFGRAGSIGRG